MHIKVSYKLVAAVELDESQLGYCAIDEQRHRDVAQIKESWKISTARTGGAGNRPASALEQLSRPNTTYREVFKAPDFTGDGNVEDFIQQFYELTIANDWSGMATLLRIRIHLKDNVRKCGSHATLEEVLEALRSKYGLTIREARTRLTSLKRDTKLSLTDHVTEVKSWWKRHILTSLRHTDRPVL